MNGTSSKWVGASLLIGLLLAGSGCQKEGVYLGWEPLQALNEVPATAVIESADLHRHDFTLDPEANRYRPADRPQQVPWIYAERFRGLTEEYFSEAELFQQAAAERPVGESEVYMVLRPRVVVNQYIRPSVSGTMLTLGTGLIYSILGGSAHYRYVNCELAMDVQTSTGRPIGSYLSDCRSAERLVTARPEQLGPLVSYGFTKALEDVANQISADNDLLMRAVHIAKGPRSTNSWPMRITIREGREVVVRTEQVRISGHVLGVDRPVTLECSVNGTAVGQVPLTGTAAASVKEFSFQAALPEGLATLVLRARGKAAKGARGKVLSEERMRYWSVRREPPVAGPRRRWAVVIGVSDYAHDGKRFSDLKYAHRDAAAFRDFLLSDRSGGYDESRVKCLIDKDATAAKVRHALFEFLAKADREDLVVIFFSGHGMPQPGTENFFMLCHDTRPERLASTAFPMWDIDTALRRFIKARRVVVLVDACHAGATAFAPGGRGKGDNPVHQYLEKLALAEPGRLILTASEARELSYEGKEYDGGHGVFAYFLLKALNGAADKDGDGVVTVREMVDYVRPRVSDATKGKQHPNHSGSYDPKLPLAVPGKRK